MRLIRRSGYGPVRQEESSLGLIHQCLQWPSIKKAIYSVRLSSSNDFSKQVIEKSGLPYAIFNPHKQLANGKWYWQYKTNDGPWNSLDSFVITATTRKFLTPDIQVLSAAIPSTHPRVLINRQKQSDLKMQSAEYKETALVIAEANGYISQPLPQRD